MIIIIQYLYLIHNVYGLPRINHTYIYLSTLNLACITNPSIYAYIRIVMVEEYIQLHYNNYVTVHMYMRIGFLLKPKLHILL